MLCDCGKKKICRWSHIKYGKILSCGCHSKLVGFNRLFKHGLKSHKLYKLRSSIITRCYNPNNKRFHCYGGDGVTMCKEWLESFETFYKWCLENGWEEGLQIDKDILYKEKHGTLPGKIYSPEFCQFVTQKANARCTRTNVFIDYNGENKTIAEWCEIYGLSQKHFYARRKRGWSLEKTLTTIIGLPNNKKRI